MRLVNYIRARKRDVVVDAGIIEVEVYLTQRGGYERKFICWYSNNAKPLSVIG